MMTFLMKKLENAWGPILGFHFSLLWSVLILKMLLYARERGYFIQNITYESAL